MTSIYYIFFLITRPPPKSTLFPYTTLFRSAAETRDGAAPARTRPPDTAAAPASIARPCTPAPARPIARDRKSTRLNSSHVRISYAVFCLKKKKKDRHTAKLNHDHYYEAISG